MSRSRSSLACSEGAAALGSAVGLDLHDCVCATCYCEQADRLVTLSGSMVGKRMFNVVNVNETPGVPPLCRGVGTIGSIAHCSYT